MRNFIMPAMVVAASTMAAPAIAQDIQGYWQGHLQLGGASLPLGIGIEDDGNGGYSGWLDSPAQNGFDIPLTDVALTEGVLTFAVPAIGATYRGEWNAADERWDGVFSQGQMTLRLNLTAGTAPDRPETSGPPELPSDWTMPDDDAIAAIIAERVANRPGAGMVVGVIEPQVERFIGGGVEGFDSNTIFEIGSMTKVFVSLLLADMALDGTVSLDDPVARYLPDGASMPSRGGQQITLRNLSQQDSGLPRLPANLDPADMTDPYADYTEAQLLEFLAGYELTRDIGSEYEYSNLGVGLLGYALGRADGSDFGTALRNRVLDPLGLEDTRLELDEEQQTRFADGFDDYMRPTSPWRFDVLAGAGALKSTAADIAKFLQAALDPASPIADAMALAVSETRAGPGYTAGLGWMMSDAPSGQLIGHGGGTGGFRSQMILQPESGRAVVVLTNAAPEPSAQDIALHVLMGSPVAPTGDVPEPPEQVNREEVALTDAQLDRVVGTYSAAPGVDVIVARDADGLTVQLPGQNALRVYPSGPLTFFYRAVNAEIVFTQNEAGQISGATFTQDGTSTAITRVD